MPAVVESPGGTPTKWWHPLALGGVAGSMGELLAQPMIVVRTRMMVQGVSSQTSGEGLVRYSGFVDTCRTMFRTEGIGSFYKGAALNAASTPFARGLYMAGLELSKAIVGEGTAARDFAAGTAAQLVGSLAYVPRDVIIERCAIDGQLQNQVGSCASSIQAFRTMLAHEGFRGFYRAYVPHQFVWIPYNGIFFSLLGRLQDTQASFGLAQGSFGLGMLNTAACAAVAGWITTPIDVIKTRVQVQGANPQLFEFTGPVDCSLQLIRREGPTALFSGAVARMAYLVPNMAVFIPLYELLKSLT
mmetsp:Transcript_113361/g.293452  ORF Transcript_113361/g.293452 Transcript_113361/m.293452 type:complete len:301 (-) Transcript_113361:77-979(-)